MLPLITEDDVRNSVVSVARSQVGKHYGLANGTPNPTPYGQWYGPGCERALFCAVGATWCWYQGLFTTADGRRFLGWQTVGGVAPRTRGYIWTVAIWEQFASQRTPLANLKPGDFVLYKYPTSGPRNKYAVNHVDLVEANNLSGGYLNCIGFNVPRPDAPAGTDQSRGGGVWRRRIYYGKPDPTTRRTNPYVVGGVRIKADVIAAEMRAEWVRVQKHLTALKFAQLQGTGVVGPATTQGIRAYAAKRRYTGHVYDRVALLAHLERTVT